MSDVKHTPGPWWAAKKSDRSGFVLAEVTNEWDIRSEYAHEDGAEFGEADAHLIAAAPDMLDALEFADRRSRQPNEGHTEYFERLADEFYRQRGYLPPSKDDPMRTASQEEAQAAWQEFLNEPMIVRRNVIAKAKGYQDD